MLYLVLEDGAVYPGESFGYEPERDVTGEAVFTTGMTGYLETLTDKSYHGQIVVQTFPLIGNCGVIPGDFESETPQPLAYVVKEHCGAPSNFRSEGTLAELLRERRVPGLCGVDTRSLTGRIREKGVMNAVLTRNPDNVDLPALKAYKVENALAAVSVKEPKFYPVDNEKNLIVVMDYGYKENIARELNARGCSVTVLPHGTRADEILRYCPDGILLSNGPGDPADCAEEIKQIRALRESNVKIMGICLGHQLLALAHGAKTYKLKYGHRGANQPVRDISTGRIFVTSQNHGYAVDTRPMEQRAASTLFENVNDGTNEGMRYADGRAFSAQFHPEACAGPRDTANLFDLFIERLG